ncbi:MAG: hypothetical protein SOV48_01805 [Intestinibacter sp.]|nr:hypothetical protein [Intestinibacter sp.]
MYFFAIARVKGKLVHTSDVSTNDHSDQVAAALSLAGGIKVRMYIFPETSRSCCCIKLGVPSSLFARAVTFNVKALSAFVGKLVTLLPTANM